MGRFSEKVAIVTGGASGIGAATVERLSSEGAKVMIADLGEPADTNRDVKFMRTDVSSEAQVNALVEATVKEWGQLDIMVNNAGIGSLSSTPDTDPETWEKIFAVNSTGVFLCCRAAIPHMREKGGAIVNTASISGLFGDYFMPAYNASKGAVVNYTRSLALECAEFGIRVNAVCPGLVETPLVSNVVGDPEDKEHWVGLIPLGRAARPEDIAAAIAFLSSEDAACVTGVNLPIDGGLTAHTGQPNLVTRAKLRAERNSG
ncbi:MAG: SDR family oxidoreductase [Sphingomonadaceae bacterium]|nr:SDR family oxidoreductase [Sphingomonadaceae bacterium]